MKFISLFAGIGGFDLGFERAGMECVAQVEKDPFCLRVLEKHWPNVQRFEDVRDFGKHNAPPADLICGGFPCQDVSLAGERAGLQGKRSTLWSEFYRIICEICPRWVVIENVRGLLSSDDGRFMRKILRELSIGGYDAEWQIIPASAIGAPHIRERVFIVAYPGGKPESFRVFNRNSQEVKEWYLSSEKWCQDRNFLEVGTPPNQRVSIYQEGLSFPNVPLLVDGVPEIVDAVKALGNAVVPQIAEFIARSILQAESNPTLPAQRPACRLGVTWAKI